MDKLALSILHEGKDFLVIDKPSGMVVHPSETGHKVGTIVHVLKGKIAGGDPLRPGIVHRLDKDTSGVMVVVRTQRGYEYFSEQFKKKAVKKVYLALVKGILRHKEGIIDSPIGRRLSNRKKMDVVAEGTGKEAVSVYKVLEEFEVWRGGFVSFVEVRPETGRTHQIRVHMSAIGHPVVGDETYGVKSFNHRFFEEFGLQRQFLHAWKIGFKDLNNKKVEFEADLPEELAIIMEKLKKL